MSLADTGRRMRDAPTSDYGVERVLNDRNRLYLEVDLTGIPPDYLPNLLESEGFSHKGYSDLSDVVGLRSLTPSLSPM